MPVCVFAKPPLPGRAKTRLAAKVGNTAACTLATAFISDFFTDVLRRPWAIPVLATTEDGLPDGAFPAAAFPPGVAPGSVQRWLQPPGDLGAKLEGIVRRGLGGSDAVLCCGADSPGRPERRLDEALEALRSGADAVLGPTEDGGYDLLGLRSCPEGLLAELPWSQPTTFAATLARLEQRGLRVVVLERWWDVDEVEDLQRLQALLRSGGADRAPATAAACKRLRRYLPPPLRKPVFGSVADVGPASRGLNLQLRCISLSELEADAAWDALCGDATGAVALRLRSAEHAALCTAGASLRVQNATAGVVEGRLCVFVDKWAVIKVADAAFEFEPNVSNDLSARPCEAARRDEPGGYRKRRGGSRSAV